MPHCFISGISDGIGLALADALWQRGWEVSGCARNGERLAALAQRYGSRWHGVTCDVRDPQAVRAAVARVCNLAGPIDRLVANAGRGTDGPLLDCPEAILQDCFAVNCFGVHHLIRAAHPHLAPDAVIQIVSSLVALVPVPLMGAYCASKQALEAYATVLRLELAATGISVLSVCPGTIATGFFDHTAAWGSAWTWRPGRPLACAVLVDQMLRQAQRRRPRRLVTPCSARLVAWAGRLLPGLTEIVLRRMLRRLQR